MTEQLLEQLTDWQEADQAATLAESAVAEALRLELEGGPVVNPAVLHEVARLRAVADQKLSASMQVLARRAEENEAARETPLQ
jgi:hypothetical protein